MQRNEPETFKRKNGGGVFALSAKLSELMQGFLQERAYLSRPLARTNLAQKAAETIHDTFGYEIFVPIFGRPD
jgi:hypothetical protein